MDRRVVAEIASHFEALPSLIPLRAIRPEQDYDHAVATLNQLLDSCAVALRADFRKARLDSRIVMDKSSDASDTFRAERVPS